MPIEALTWLEDEPNDLAPFANPRAARASPAGALGTARDDGLERTDRQGWERRPSPSSRALLSSFPA